MDRKIIKNTRPKHADKPSHQRWLYEMLEWGFAKAMLVIWLICIGTILLALITLKLIFGGFK